MHALMKLERKKGINATLALVCSAESDIKPFAKYIQGSHLQPFCLPICVPCYLLNWLHVLFGDQWIS